MNIFLLEDDTLFAQIFKAELSLKGKVVHCRNLQDARTYLQNNLPDIAFVDLHLAQENGLEIFKHLNCPKAVLSGSHHPEEIEKAYELGAEHFFTKRGFKQTVPQFIKATQTSSHFEDTFLAEYLTIHAPLLTQLKLLTTYPLKDKSLFIAGPTGVGKSKLGKALHHFLHPEEAPFVHLNCSEIADTLLESELFGHEKGAFTGATQKKEGKLKMAHRGTLFLDEIGTMSIEMQRKLLKAIEEKTFYPVGSSHPEKVQFTLITASCENMEEKIKRGQFREDLYYRLKSYTAYIPPLCERPEDIQFLLDHFIGQSERLILLRPEAWQLLKKYSWPGNIRELKHLAEAIIHHPKGVITSADLHSLLGQDELESSEGPSLEILTPESKEHILQVGLRHYFEQIENEMVEYTLDKFQGKITDCIKALKISSSAFYRILEKK